MTIKMKISSAFWGRNQNFNTGFQGTLSTLLKSLKGDFRENNLFFIFLWLFFAK